MVQVRVFNQEGSLVGPVDSPRVTLSDAEWQSRLTPEQFRVLRSKGTERPFCGTLLDNKQQGVYVCAGCGLPLFASDAKFQSGTGWPSFFQPIARENIAEETDKSHGMVRVEILCARCDGHLGHVFEDGPRPTGLRYCLNSESLFFTPSEHLAKLADAAVKSGAMPAASGGHASIEEKPSGRVAGAKDSHSGATGGLSASANAHTSESKSVETAAAIFAGGCFWCTEAAFEQLDGVLDVESGYIGGTKETANYARVCDGNTGHAEAIRITYDPRRITYDQLLDVFFDAHDPTQLNRQGNDYGTQYRSAIFCADEREKGAATAKIAALNKSGAFDQPIVTTLEPLATFYPAEAYHQDYARNNPEQPYIQYQAIPKVCKVRTKHAKLIRKDA